MSRKSRREDKYQKMGISELRKEIKKIFVSSDCDYKEMEVAEIVLEEKEMKILRILSE